jgi:hypothetical protein
MKPNISKCIWTACIMAVAVCMTVSRAGAADNLGHGYVSSVTSSTNCVYNEPPNGNGPQFWDIQAGGTYTVTLSGVDDAANGGMDATMSVIVHNSAGGNMCVVANQVTDGGSPPVGVQGEYTFTITLTTQCLTMPIEYGTLSCNPKSPQCPNPVAGCKEGTGMFAQDNGGGVAGGKEGHLRTTIFDENCNKVSDDTTCQGGGGSTGSITVCKYYDNNANGFQDTGEPNLTGWPFCINPLDGGIPALVTQLTASGGCATWSNLTTPGDYVVTEANANETNWFHSTGGTSMIMLASGGTETRTFGNYCTAPSGGLTLGFWSNKNGNKLLTGSPTGNGTTLLPAVVNLLNAGTVNCPTGVMRNANGTIKTFTTNYSQFRTWLLSATATNMAYMLSAQLAALKLDVNFGFVDGNAFDLCSSATVNGLITTASDQLCMDGNTVAGNPTRTAQEMLKNCIDAINNNGAVVPVTPCPFSFPNPPAPCP